MTKTITLKTKMTMSTSNINPNEQDSQSQRKRVLAWLQDGNTITGLEAIFKFGCIRLSARISELIGEGYSVDKEWVETESGKRVMRYSMKSK